ncbi:hypothetical protein NYO67_158 [Aspergillus flavus]|nr:hypothetical protein NYO67_158 [Aspergillus flavus]
MKRSIILVLGYLAMLILAGAIHPLVTSIEGSAPPSAGPVSISERSKWIPLDPSLSSTSAAQKYDNQVEGFPPSNWVPLSRRAKGTGKCGYWNVDGHIAQCDCIMKGNEVANSYIAEYTTSACAAFLSKIPDEKTPKGKWLRFAVKNVVDTGGQLSVLNFWWKKLSKNGMTLTQDLCQDAYNRLGAAICDTNRGKSTKGTTIRIGGEDGVEIGMDPDKMKNFSDKDKRYINVGDFIDALSSR